MLTQIEFAVVASRASLSEQIRELIKNPADLLETAERFSVTSSTIRKILAGKTMSPFIAKKIRGVLGGPVQSCPPYPDRWEIDERFREIHRLYQTHGTLAAVGKEIGVTRERVRQILIKGSKRGLFEYRPHRGRRPLLVKGLDLRAGDGNL